jgi:quercetin dioxygenase-like cupin family protein/ribosome-binding protein aMBF1 (putative translation factor)
MATLTSPRRRTERPQSRPVATKSSRRKTGDVPAIAAVDGQAEKEHAPDPRDAVDGVGARLRTERQRRGLSLRQFARDLGVSASFLSQLELGRSQASVATLYSICSALGLSIDELFAAEEVHGLAAESKSLGPAVNGSVTVGSGVHGSPVVTPEHRKRLDLDSGVTWEQLSTRHDPSTDFMLVTYDVGGSSTPDNRLQRHSGIEHGYIISGDLEVTLGFETYRVGPGDAISFDSATPHRLTNVGDTPVQAVWVVHGRQT